MNIKKLFSVAAVVTFLGSTFLPGLALAATPDTELGKAYEWAYANGITTKDTYEAANMTAPITRAEMAKMLSNYAKKFQEKTPDTSATCNFNDTASVGGDLAVAIVESCQLGIMGQGINAFRPYDTITRAEFGTALSRVLWDKTYEGGTPYYAGHLNALKAAGIMTVIANAESMKEVRGYVMLMLMRSENETPSICEETDVKVICAVEEAAEEYKDCPAACRKDNTKDSEKEDTVVKSGDLAVTAKAAEGRKALIGGTSDLDTITFKTSEDVTISSITLERYGYSTIADVKSVQLEDEDGTIIADAKEPNSKGQVKLTLKKDYKTVDGTFKATVVVNVRSLPATVKNGATPEEIAAYGASKNGSTLGFKVIAAESTAKNLNLDDYNPYTYDLVNYGGSAVQFSSRNSTTKEHNFEAGELYEVAKFRVKAPADAAILVKGFTLTDDKLTEGEAPDEYTTWKGNAIDADKYAKDVKVTVNGKEVSGLKWNINKDDELVISFSEIEVAGKETATIAVSMSFNEDFDKFGESVQYYIKDLSKFNAIDKKTETRVTEDANYSIAKLRETWKWTVYTLKGGKIKLSGTKLWTVNAAAGSTNVKVAEGNITVTEAIRWTASIKVDAETIAAIDEIRLVVNGEEFDGSKGANGVCTFKGVEIDKSGKVEVRVDLKSNDELNDITAVNFVESINSTSFKGFKYDESGEEVKEDWISGSISLSNIRIQAAKASLTNKATKKAELVINDNNRKTIFEGTYEAKKGAVTLKNFVITSTADDHNLSILLWEKNYPTFYVKIGNDDYDAKWTLANCGEGNDKYPCAKWDIDDIEVADGKSVDVKVEIEYTPKAADPDAVVTTAMHNTFNIALEWEDEDNNTAGQADEESVRVEVVKQGTIDIKDTSAKKTVLLKSNKDVATFTITPSKSSDDEIILNNITFVWAGDIEYTNLKFNIDNDDYTSTTTPGITAVAGKDHTYQIANIGTSIPSKWSVVKVTLRSEAPETGAKGKLTISTINGKPINSEFNKYYVPATVKVTQNNGKGKDTTQYTAELENDTSYAVSDLTLYIDGACADNTKTVELKVNGVNTPFCPVASKKDLSEGSADDNKFTATNDANTAHSITAITYIVNDKATVDASTKITILKSEFENFFEKAYCSSDKDCDDLMVYSNKS